MRFAIGLVLQVLATVTAAEYAVKTPPLDTPWTYKVGTNPWPEYPRPQLQRSQWQNLNGIWNYESAPNLRSVKNPPFGQQLAEEVLIPSCLESGLSGIQGNSTFYSWFQTQFTVPEAWGDQRVLLNFAAVDYEATVFVNGEKAGFHRGGYFSFTLDVTDFLADGDNELLVFVHDPTDDDGFLNPVGKQVLHPSHIFYTPCSGIWQQVWIEAAPANHITRLDLSADMDGQVTAKVLSSEAQTPLQITVRDRDSNQVVGTKQGTSGKVFKFDVPDAKLWSPDSPTLYDISVTMGEDKISSYTGFRTIAKGTVNDIERPLLNGEFIFQFGTLDQGFWPDGIYTPPNKDAMKYDLQVLKDLGFNLVRKHIKVENPLFYQACDEMGLMVIQDMPSLPFNDELPDEAQQAEFERQLDILINQHKSYPSIITWVIYNEGWGQITDYYPEIALADRVKKLDPTRLVDATSGWYDHGAGDFSDNHHYANPQCGSPFNSIPSSPYDPTRIGIQGEFGGIGLNTTANHLWKVTEAINSINETYELDADRAAWNYRSHRLLDELRDQIKMYSCSAAIWTQTTDVEGEVNGLLTYDRRVRRTDVGQWKADIQALYDAAKSRT